MLISQLILILCSGLGVLHGIVFSLFLWYYKKGITISNKILAVLLFILSTRVGKSVWIFFVKDSSALVIFLGLALLLAIGPLLLFYFKVSLLKQNLKSKDGIHFIPLLFAIPLAIWINFIRVENLPVIFFVVLFVCYYGQMLAYLLYVLFKIKTHKLNKNDSNLTTEWLTIITYMLLVLWLVYVSNLFEQTIPYIIGPIVYSMLIYGVTLLAIKRGYIAQLSVQKYQTTPVKEVEVELLFDDIVKLLTQESYYKNTSLNLDSLCKHLNATPQKISMVINTKSGMNFNQFVNSFRINKAKELLLTASYRQYTIAHIAFEVGFNSINSFNQAFKRETGLTPSAFKGK